jgi:hypothetical protein
MDAAAGLELPQQPSGPGIEGNEFPGGKAGEDQAAARRQHRASTGCSVRQDQTLVPVVGSMALM